MNVSYLKMTGPELKKIHSISGMNGDEFAKRLGISRAGLYLLFKDKVISPLIERRLNEDEDLENFRQMLSSQKSGPSPELKDEMITTLNKVVTQILKVNEELTSSHRTYRVLVEQALDAGAVQIDRSKIKLVSSK